MKTVQSAILFKAFDPDNNKTVEAEDIVRILASVNFDDMILEEMDEEERKAVTMDAETAHAIALTILRDQVINGQDPSVLSSRPYMRDGYSFTDFMGTQVSGAHRPAAHHPPSSAPLNIALSFAPRRPRVH